MNDNFITVEIHCVETGDELAGVEGQPVVHDVLWHAMEYPDGHGRWLIRDTNLNVIGRYRLGGRVQVIRNVADGEGTVEAVADRDRVAAAATPTPCPPHGLARIRGLYMVVR